MKQEQIKSMLDTWRLSVSEIGTFDYNFDKNILKKKERKLYSQLSELLRKDKVINIKILIEVRILKRRLSTDTFYYILVFRKEGNPIEQSCHWAANIGGREEEQVPEIMMDVIKRCIAKKRINMHG